MAIVTPAPPEKLRRVCDEAFKKHPTACNQAVLHVIRSLVDPNFPLMTANEMCIEFQSRWKLVTEDATAQLLADSGKVVVAGMVSAIGSGHVVVIYPGGMKESGGFKFINDEGDTCVAQSHGCFPRAMSTSMSTEWPGTKSCGDKTAYDSWGDKFDHVTYFTPPEYTILSGPTRGPARLVP